MRVGGLFSGIGGLEEGLERAGMQTVWTCECDPFCREILQRRFPHAKRHFKDVTKLRPGISKYNVDLICGGFPCQPVAVSGNRHGEEDERWLWPYMLDVIEWCQPGWVVIENVPGLRTLGLDSILEGLAACGYDAEWDRISAQEFGAPQQRQRYFLVAYPEGQFESSLPGIFKQPPIDVSAFYRHCDLRSRRLYRVGKGKVDEITSPFMGRWWWRTEPRLDRVAYGIPDLLDRSRVLGNAVVPQISEWIGRQIMEVAQVDYDSDGELRGYESVVE